MWSAKRDIKSIVRSNFKNPEQFSINESEGVIFECLMLKNSPKNDEYFKNIFISPSFKFFALAYLDMLTYVRSMDLRTNL